MNDKLSFSLIIPTYNRGYILWKTIQSIQNQSWPYWELIIIDDGSTDDTKKVIREFQKDPRIQYHYKENEGSSAARNRGLEKASNEIITYIDSDDEIMHNYLLVAKEYFQNDPSKNYALCNGNFRREYYNLNGFIEKAEIVGPFYDQVPDIRDIYEGRIRIAAGTGCFHRKIFNKKVSWRNLSPVEDLEFFMQLVLQDPSGYVFIPYVLYEYKQRYGSDGIYANSSHSKWANAIKQVYELHKNDPYMKNPENYFKNLEFYQKMFS